MNDMVCPYCGAEWEHEYDDLRYTDGEGEYECPSCERIFIMSGELEPVFYEETAEDYYERKIMLEKDFVEYYKEKIAMYIENGDKKEAEYYKSMLDMYYLPDLRELEESLERCIEHNKKVVKENDCKKPVLIKSDRILGYAFFCPHCKVFQCSGKGNCTKCGRETDWENEQKYEGKVRWK